MQQRLIKWRSRPLEEATWEDALVIQNQFPEAGLEDKTIFEGVTTDTNAMSKHKPNEWKVYSRRPKAH